MAYIAPYIDETGLHIPSYEDIKEDLIDKMKEIYGNDLYLEPDSQDYQMISAFSLMLSDAMQSILLSYNNSSPLTAVSTGLDKLVQLNGITRRMPTKSFCKVKLQGAPGTIIINGVVQDINGINWFLPEYVVISGDGTAEVDAECEQFGAIQVPVGGINKIITTVSGWTSVQNEELAIVGEEPETDSQLRARQAKSASISAKAIKDAIVAGILNLDGVKKVVSYENDTSTAVGVYPPHSITIVVDGGNDIEIANEIYWRKTIGTATNGNTEVEIDTPYAGKSLIKFQRPIKVDAYVDISITFLVSQSSEILDEIKNAVADFIADNTIGKDLYISTLYGAIYTAFNKYPTIPFYINSIEVNGQTSFITVGDFEYLDCQTSNITIDVGD